MWYIYCMDDMYPITSKLYPADDEPASMEDLLRYFLKRGSLRVSDLHLKVGMPPCYRIDGTLQPVQGPPLTETVIEGLVFSLLGPSERQQLAETGSVDGSFPLDRLQFRFNAFQDADGIAIALRALENDIPPVDALGFPNDVWKDIVGMQQGLVLLTGITGSGKSTTISSMINHIAMTRKCRIITLEDPVEYRLKSSRSMISQREVGRHVQSFSEGIRAGLREDPDVIFVGEMRDVESARWTLTAAETGHLVFSTLHTRDTRGTLTRLIDMYPANQQDEIASQLSLGLSYVIAQKLIPRASGKGRVVAMEIMQNTYSIGNLIRLRKFEQIYSQLQTNTHDRTSERMCTMERSLADLASRNIITPLEAERWAEDRASFADELQRFTQS